MPLKVTDDYYDDLQEEKIEEYSEKYMLKDSVVRDIFLEGWDLCCAFYENKTGKVKQSIIRDQYPELFENQVELDIVNQNTLIDMIGHQTHSTQNKYITQQEAKEKLKEIKDDMQTILMRDTGYQNAKSLIINKVNDIIKRILEEENN